MRLTDLLILPVAALWQQKLRTILTTLGVIFGAFVLAASLSIGEGVQETIDRESRKNDYSRKVTVYPGWKMVNSKARPKVEVEGTMSPERRERLRKALQDQNQSPDARQVLTEISSERLATLAKLPHVARVIPIVQDSGVALLGTKPEGTGIYSGNFDDEAFQKRIFVGRGFRSPDEHGMLVSELLAYRIGLVNDSDLQQLIGKPLRLEITSRGAEPGFNVWIPKAAGVVSEDEQRAMQQLAAQLPGRSTSSPSPTRRLRSSVRHSAPVPPPPSRKPSPNISRSSVCSARRPRRSRRRAGARPRPMPAWSSRPRPRPGSTSGRRVVANRASTRRSSWWTAR